ncbi:RelA/SpoT domain-containing protein [Vibrio sp. SM6]|uniref:RelA/SpoT domain-containing protein n=1 Tax=Vibrio agarilyticus TaxID=2726741 RepID=A0A7X8TQW8_9VIBR|nr:RelA/SpoT domain-containing protein [Vibrio agarilyticus]NLS12947.1 RelA/SpoT domain-containing protein [Vibrio agarilyticus]
MNILLRTTALMLLVLSRAPAISAAPLVSQVDNPTRATGQNQVCPKLFRHSLNGLYGITNFDNTPPQPENDFERLYDNALTAQTELETLCSSAALLSDTKTVFAGVKSRERAQEKIATELGGNVSAITDIARATISADSIEALVSAFEVLERETTIVRVKNRFKEPARSGYRDLNILVKLPQSGHIAEVQMHLAAIAEVKSGPEHLLYEKIQKIERVAATEQRDLNDIELAEISKMRRTSKQLYQDAWQPYLTPQAAA